MQYSREEHIHFLEEELKAQTEAFKQRLDTSALFLLQEREEIFLAQFLKFFEGEMILKFSNTRGLPRQGEYLYCFTVPKELRDYRSWSGKTYGDLIKEKDNFTECVCIWQAPSDDKDFSIAGFRGVDIEFSAHIQGAEGMILILGPNKPPFEYLTNLQKVVANNSSQPANKILDQDFKLSDWKPTLINDKINTVNYIKDQLTLQDTLIIQGPPGTGKTHFIAELIETLAAENKSILVTALTNRALIEIVEKPALNLLLEQGRVYKTKLSVDEVRLHKKLLSIKEIAPLPGSIVLSTFYITSGEASKTSNEPPFDFVIVDEASQAFLAMFASASILGKKNIWVGDTKQLPPVVTFSEDKVKSKNYGALVDGLKALTVTASLPIFQLTVSFRLTIRSVSYTGIFYNNTIISKSKKNIRLYYSELDEKYKRLFHLQGGPTLIKMEFPIGGFKPINGIDFIAEIVFHLLQVSEPLHIAVLSFFVESTKALQKKIYQTIGYRKNLLIETVSRIQGLTTDICIYFIPNSSYHRSLDNRLFNVATSRAKRQTLIIADKNILNRSQFDNEVKKYIEQVNADFSFYIETEPGLKLLTN